MCLYNLTEVLLKLAEYLVSKGISQTECAKSLNVNRSNVHHWIYKYSPPSGQKMMEIYRWSNGRVGLKDWCEEFMDA